MAVVYLIRHAQASFGTADYDVLSELGHRQAELLGAELLRRGVRPNLVCSGSMRRQRDSAATCLASGRIPVSIEVDERWNEYDHVDVLARYGAQDDSARLRLEGALRRWVADGDSGRCAEGWPAFRARVRAALDDLFGGLDRGGSALAFTSGGVISAICADLLGIPEAGFLGLNRVTVNASVTKIVRGRSGINLVSFNDHAHFEGEHRQALSYR
ncbi:MAG: histidine phosphatase family protein [Sciscionella sp.]